MVLIEGAIAHKTPVQPETPFAVGEAEFMPLLRFFTNPNPTPPSDFQNLRFSGFSDTQTVCGSGIIFRGGAFLIQIVYIVLQCYYVY